MTSKKINDAEALQGLYQASAKAAGSISNLVKQNPYFKQQDGKWGSAWWSPVPLSLDLASYVPRLPTLRFSALNFIRNEEWPSPRDALRQYRPQAFNPLNWIPPIPKVAHVFNGQNLITFDGKHITLSGTCQYVLAQDAVNGNLTIVAQLANGHLNAISLVDKNGDSVEISAGGAVKVNGQSTEYPVHQNQLHAWHEYYSVQALSTWGARVLCSVDLKVCHVYVNGFYHNKLRGLLGNANAEPFDDAQLPSGEVKKLDDALAAYKLKADCPAVKIVQHDHAKEDADSAECREVFGWGSPLRSGYLLIDVQPYRDACAHSVASASNKLEAACDVAFAYASVCRTENIPARVPDQCQKCRSTDASGKPIDRSIGEFYTVISPQKKADIVLVIDTAIGTPLNELVDALITELRAELKARDVADTQIAVIGYNKKEKYLSQFTAKGKLDITGKFAVPKWKSAEELQIDPPVNIGGCEHFNNISRTANSWLQRLQDDFGLGADGRAFRRALQYPFRADAGKAILAIRSDTLTYSANPVSDMDHYISL